ncbi:MAG: bifunctional sugar-1-phosphate nucleotidylyltransferase/acetyltransferase [Candidatus Bathyarchaeota archaeon]
MKALILAAGEGARLQPMTTTRPKHLLPIAGRPTLEHLLLAIRDAGINQVMIIVGYRSEMIENYFEDGKRLGLELTYIHQERPLGTANAISLGEKYIEEDYFLVIYGDLYINPCLIKSLIKKHQKTGLSSIAVVPVKNPQEFGIISLEDGFVKGIVEKPKAGEGNGNLANTGIYIFPREIFREISNTHASPRSEYEITDTILLLLKKGIRLAADIIEPENWLDLGRPWDLLEANERALKSVNPEIKGIVESGVNILGDVGIEEGARIRSGSYLEGPIIIGGGSDIGPNCYIRPFTSIGKNVRIGNACEVKASLILDGTHVGHLSYIGDSIIGENCNLGAGTITANLRLDDGTVKVLIKSELVDSGLRKFGVIMGDNVKTGVGVSIMPGVKLGPNAWIGPDVTVFRDVGEAGFISQMQNLRAHGEKKTPSSL